jgi:hypothetical protein
MVKTMNKQKRYFVRTVDMLKHIFNCPLMEGIRKNKIGMEKFSTVKGYHICWMCPNSPPSFLAYRHAQDNKLAQCILPRCLLNRPDQSEYPTIGEFELEEVENGRIVDNEVAEEEYGKFWVEGEQSWGNYYYKFRTHRLMILSNQFVSNGSIGVPQSRSNKPQS